MSQCTPASFLGLDARTVQSRRAGANAERERVARLMRSEASRGAKRGGKPWRTTKSDRRPDLVQRDFTVGAPNELCVADRSYRRCVSPARFATVSRVRLR